MVGLTQRLSRAVRAAFSLDAVGAALYLAGGYGGKARTAYANDVWRLPLRWSADGVRPARISPGSQGVMFEHSCFRTNCQATCSTAEELCITADGILGCAGIFEPCCA